MAVPKELLEAARIDDAGELTIFTRIVVPMLAPALAVMQRQFIEGIMAGALKS